MKYDIIYLWVDASDPSWRHKKKQHTPPEEDLVSYADSNSRYRNNEELYVSLQSMRYYAHDVGAVYLVTDGQVPSWLEEFPEVILVDHADILECTPVFNTRAILNQVHKIPELRDYFIVMNDDIFFNKHVGFNDFFHQENGVVFVEAQPADISDGRAHHSRVHYVEQVLNVPCRDVLAHAAIPIYKPTYMEMIEQYKPLYHRVNHQRFRQNTGVSIQYLYHYHILHHYGHRHVIHSGYYESGNLDAEMLQQMKRDTAAFICINDTWDNAVPETQQYALHAWYNHLMEVYGVAKRYPVAAS